MSFSTRCLGALAIGAALLAAAPAVADEAGRAGAPEAAGGQRAVAVVTVVRARDLISPAERQAYRQAMREAKTPEARQQIRRSMMERVSQRAAEHGKVIVIEARMMRQGQRWSEREVAPVHTAPAPVHTAPAPVHTAPAPPPGR